MSKVVLRIAQNILCSLTSASDAKAQETDIEKSPDTLKTGHLIIIDQELERLKPFAKDAGWIMDIAETLFGRKNNGRLWLLPEPNQQGTANDWLAVNRNDALRSGIYEFKGYGAKIVLSRMYTDAVKYPKSGSDQTSDFAQSVNLRHWNKCAVTGINRLSSSCTASHLTLRRLGHVPTQRIIERSETDVTWPRAHENSRAGVLLIDNIDRLVDSFRAGFYTPDPSVSLETHPLTCGYACMSAERYMISESLRTRCPQFFDSERRRRVYPWHSKSRARTFADHERSKFTWHEQQNRKPGPCDGLNYLCSAYHSVSVALFAMRP